ncbi:hypothetical protein EOM60_03580 [Candidatus Saccharibacteria bacterium]|nr:hypothetical protein [Candidatus Saccharibacteria bacterium]
MKIDDYSKQAITALTDGHAYGAITSKLMAQILGLVGESGEIAEKFKKILRDKQGKISETDRQEILKELGDVLWYVNSTAHLLGSSLEEVAKMNNEKLASRKSRGEIHGSGDNR